MKNLHILPAKNPQVSAKGQIYLATHDIPDTHYPIRLVRSKPNSLTSHRKECVRQELYITSDEEIKEGDWVFDLDVKRIVKADSLKVATSKKSQCWYYKKIILTTDQDLIKDGIQAIDDEFLEWLVKNPTCEEVKFKDIKDTDGKVVSYRFISALIPKEEPKQETFEEAVQKVANSDDFINGALFGSLWQQERMYSEEEVKKLIELHSDFIDSKIDYDGINNATTAISDPEWNDEEWFEQVKKINKI